MEYYPIQKHWSRKFKPHLNDEEAQLILVRDFNRYTFGLWQKPFEQGMKPTDFESCDWRCSRRGKQPEYWGYVKHAACHWLVNFNRRLAVLTEHKIEWGIVTSELHSTVWDGDNTLFDMNFSALEVDPDEASMLTRENGKVLRIGEYHICHYVQYWKHTMEIEKQVSEQERRLGHKSPKLKGPDLFA